MATLIEKKKLLMGVKNQGRRDFPGDPIVKTLPSNAGSVGSIHLQEKEMQKGKILVWKDLTNSWEKKRSEGKEEKERCILDAEFQRRARRDKKDFVSDQCKEIRESNRDLFKKIKDVKEYFMQRQAQ